MQKRVLIGSLAAVAIAIGGCSSSGSGSASTDTGGNTPSSAGATGSSSESGSLDTLAAAIAAAKTPPTTLPITVPLASKPPTGKTVIYLQCEVAQCVLQGRAIQSAAAALGWTYRTLNFQAANPATLVTALTNALQYKPVAVYFAGAPYDAWKSVIPKYRAAGAYIIPSSVPGVPIDDVVITTLAADALYKKGGKLLADEVTVDSGGKAKILFVTVPAYTIFKPLEDEYGTELKAVCPGCSSQTLGATIPQVTSNQMVPAIVSALKRSPDVKYVVASNGDFLQTLPTALQAAGISQDKVKIFSWSGTSAVQELVKSGKFQSTTAFGYGYEGWLGVDAALRGLEKLPLTEAHQLLPVLLLTKDTVGTPADSYDVPTDYQAQFKKLWLLGG